MAVVNLLNPATDYFDSGIGAGADWSVGGSSLSYSGTAPAFDDLSALSFVGGSYSAPDAVATFNATVTLTGSSHYVRFRVFDSLGSVSWYSDPAIFCNDGVAANISLDYTTYSGNVSAINFIIVSADVGGSVLTGTSYSLGVSALTYDTGTPEVIVTGPFWKDFVGCESSE